MREGLLEPSLWREEALLNRDSWKGEVLDKTNVDNPKDFLPFSFLLEAKVPSYHLNEN